MTYLQARAYDETNGPQDVLLEARDIAFNEDALTLSFPELDAANAYFENEVQVAIEIEAFAGLSYGSPLSTVALQYSASGEVETRYQFEKASGSVILENGLWKYTLPAYNVVNFPDCPVSKNLGHVLQFGPTDTPATILQTRVAEAQARGMLTGVTVVDGGGWQFPNIATNLEFKNHSALDEFYKVLKSGEEADLYWVGLTLYVFAPGTMTVNRPEVEFQIDDFSALPIDYDFSNRAQSIIVVGDDGNYIEHPEDLPGRTKRVQAAGVKEPATLLQIAQRELAARQVPLRQITASLALAASSQKLPYRDYHRGSVVPFPTKDGDTENVKVAGITITRGIDPDFSGNLTLDSKIKSDEVRLYEQGKIAMGGIPEVSGTGGLIQRSLPAGRFVVATISDRDDVTAGDGTIVEVQANGFEYKRNAAAWVLWKGFSTINAAPGFNVSFLQLEVDGKRRTLVFDLSRVAGTAGPADETIANLALFADLGAVVFNGNAVGFDPASGIWQSRMVYLNGSVFKTIDGGGSRYAGSFTWFTP